MRLRGFLGFVLITLVSVGALLAHEAAVANEMAEAATRFLASLDTDQQSVAKIPFTSEERENFHFVPRERKGISLKGLRKEQEVLAMALLSSGLSHLGFAKVTSIMSLEKILYAMTDERFRHWRNSELYYFSVFGDPEPGKSWGWRFEGHHVSLNFSIAEGEHISATPSFLGSNPAIVESGPRAGLQVLREEEDLGRELARSLDSRQMKQARFSEEAPADIVTGAQRQVKPLEPKGLAWTELTEAQQTLLRRLINTYLQRHRSEIAEADLAKIESIGWEKVHFAWAGGTEPGTGHYYRVQGSTFLLEYDNTQNGANHVHSVYRDFAEDFGRDLLKEHYEKSHRR